MALETWRLEQEEQPVGLHATPACVILLRASSFMVLTTASQPLNPTVRLLPKSSDLQSDSYGVDFWLYQPLRM